MNNESLRESAEEKREAAEKKRAESSATAVKNANDAAAAVLAQVNQLTFALNAEDGGLDITYTSPEEPQTI